MMARSPDVVITTTVKIYRSSFFNFSIVKKTDESYDLKIKTGLSFGIALYFTCYEKFVAFRFKNDWVDFIWYSLSLSIYVIVTRHALLFWKKLFEFKERFSTRFHFIIHRFVWVEINSRWKRTLLTIKIGHSIITFTFASDANRNKLSLFRVAPESSPLPKYPVCFNGDSWKW